ncbi:MAG: hypothetical protein IJY08_05010 [Clostridia bacterium]|nr:hypothetical protein [Clostridia bacterium]
MFKETKSVINNETIKKELMYRTKASVPAIVVCCIVMIPMAIIGIYSISSLIGEISNGGMGNVSTEYIIFALVDLMLTVVLTMVIINTIGNYNAIRRCEFSVVEDTLTDAREETVHHGRRMSIEKAFYFSQHGRYVVTSLDGSTFEYSYIDDVFYIVIYTRSRSPYPALIYNKRIYEYKN